MAESAKKPGIADYRRAFTQDWRKHMFALMSGPFSVLFAIGSAVAAVWSAWGAVAVLALMAFGSAWYAGFEMWRIERERARELQERLIPKFELFFDRHGYPGIADQTLEIQQEDGIANHYDMKFVRIWIRAITQATVQQCTAFITALEKRRDDASAFTPVLIAQPIAINCPANVPPGVPLQLDFLASNSIALPHVSTLGAAPGFVWPVILRDVFRDTGTYRFTIAVSGSGITQEITVDINWGGWWDDLKGAQV